MLSVINYQSVCCETAVEFQTNISAMRLKVEISLDAVRYAVKDTADLYKASKGQHHLVLAFSIDIGLIFNGPGTVPYPKLHWQRIPWIAGDAL